MSALEVRQWLQYVNNQMSPEGVEYLKLALYPFLVSSYSLAERLIIPSKVYDFLLENHFRQDPDKALQWFVHAISLLGGDLRGHRIVDWLEHYEISRPNIPENMSHDQQFFECLTKIGRKARGLKLEEKLIRVFSRSGFLAIHSSNISSLPDLFIRLVQKEIISPANTNHLAAVLKRNGAKQCLFYLNEYHKSVGMEEIKEMSGSSRSDFAPTSVYESTESSDVCTRIQSRHRFKGDEQSLTLLGNIHDDDDSDDSESGSKGSPSKPKSKKSYKIMPRSQRALWIFIFMTVVVSIFLSAGFLFGEVWINLILVPNPESVNVYEDNTVIIGEIDRLYYHQVRVTTSVSVPIGQHKIDVYSHVSKCEELPYVPSNYHFTLESNTTKNFTHLYLFSESVIQYSITPMSSSETDNKDVNGYIYITKGPEINLFSPVTCQLPKADCTIVSEVPYSGKALFHSIRIKRNESGYYNIHVLIDSDYKLEVNISTAIINYNLTEYKCSINQSTSSCNIELPFGVKSRKVCLVAFTEHLNSNNFPYATLDAKVSRLWIKWVLLITLVPLTVFWIVTCAILLFFYFIVCKIRCTKSV